MTTSPTSSGPAGRVTLRRTDARDAQTRQIYARIDALRTHMLLFGETVEISLPAGSHRLKANNTLIWKSVPFELAPNQHITFSFVNRPSRIGFGLLALLGVAPLWLDIERAPHETTPV